MKAKCVMQRSPIKYYGKKPHQVVTTLLGLIGGSKVYVEVCGGSGELLLRKEPSKIEVYNDLDGNVVNLFEVLRDRGTSHRLWELLMLTPYSRQEYENCLATYDDVVDNVERARQFIVLSNQSLNGRFKGGWSRDLHGNRTVPFYNALDLLEPACHRIHNVVIENRDFENIIHYYDSSDTLFYIDPPYVPDTRTCNARYQREMGVEDHERLLSLILQVKGKVVLSGYHCPLYDEFLTGWNHVEVEVPCFATLMNGKKEGMKRQSRTEVIWTNFDPPRNAAGNAMAA